MLSDKFLPFHAVPGLCSPGFPSRRTSLRLHTLLQEMRVLQLLHPCPASRSLFRCVKAPLKSHVRTGKRDISVAPMVSVPSPGTGSPVCLARRQLCLAEAEMCCWWGEFRWHQTRFSLLLWYLLLSTHSYRCSSFFYAFCQVKSSPPC